MSIVSLSRLLWQKHEIQGDVWQTLQGCCQRWLFVVLRTSGMAGLFLSSFANLQQLDNVPH